MIKMLRRKFELSNGAIIETPFWMYRNEDGYLCNGNSGWIEALDGDTVIIDENFGKNPDYVMTGTVDGYSDFQCVGFKEKRADGSQRGTVMSAEPCRKGAMKITHNTTIVREINPPKVYISGPMTGLSEEDYSENFKKAAEMLESKGYIAYNPSIHSTISESNMSYKEILLKDINKLADFDIIYMLKGYKASKGANAEMYCAYAMGMEIMYEDSTECEVMWGDGYYGEEDHSDVIYNEPEVDEVIEEID